MGNKSVCLNCRIAFSYGMDYDNIISRTCPQCKREMINVDYKFKAPKKDTIKKWETITYLFENGFYFQHIYENNKIVKYPENIKDAKPFVEKYNAQKIIGKDK
jgi:ABC-type transport system involved in Fe-S cluster assembly fused permease/ATPase subunit